MFRIKISENDFCCTVSCFPGKRERRVRPWEFLLVEAVQNYSHADRGLQRAFAARDS